MAVQQGLPDKGVLVAVDGADGELDDAARGILAEAARLAGALNTAWAAVCFAPVSNETLESLVPYGVPEVLAIESREDLSDLPDAQAWTLAEAARREEARVLLLAHDDPGETMAPALAASLGGALWTEAVSFEAAEGGLRLTRRALGSWAVESRVWAGSPPLVLTVDPRFLSPVVLPSVVPSRPELRTVAVDPPPAAARMRVVERIPPDPQTVDVSEAEVVFCAGKGFDTENLELYREIARLAGAALGVTRPVYDLGWAGFERMIGQTGKTVAPRFYLGMGISGSVHHVGGIRDSKRIVCLNADPRAPLFPNADEGFVADLRDVLPLLLHKVRSHLGAQAAERGAP
jgi:electron transfer flavoprotein alpha subunit